MATPLPAHRMITQADVPTAGMTPAQRLDKQKRLFRKLFRAHEWLEDNNSFYNSKTLKYEQNSATSDWPGSNLQCCKCIAATKTGRRCRSSVCMGLPVCWAHSLQFLHLKSGRTTLRQGNQRLSFAGLFCCDKKKAPTAVIFHANDIVCAYLGEFVTQETVDNRYGEANEGVAPYSLQVGRGKKAFIEDSALRRSLGALVNTVLTNQADIQWGAPAAGITPNAKIDTIKIDGAYEMAVIVATRPIVNGQEVLVRSHSPQGELEYVLHNDAEITHRTKGFRPVQTACRF